MSEGGSYTPISDMFQLGRLLGDRVPWITVDSTPAREFIRKLRQKEYTEVMAFDDPWLSEPIL